MKKCTKCGKTGKFNKEKRNKDGLKSWCQECTSKARKKWGASKKEYLAEKKREWDTNNKEHQLTYAKHYALKFNYGISIEDYADMLVRQNGLCKICGQPRTDKFALSVDHDHKTGKVRGLLCGSCNFILGHSKDNPELLRKAAQYLEEA